MTMLISDNYSKSIGVIIIIQKIKIKISSTSIYHKKIGYTNNKSTFTLGYYEQKKYTGLKTYTFKIYDLTIIDSINGQSI